MAGVTPSQTVGPFFHFSLTDRHSAVELAGEGAVGARIHIGGHVLDADGAPVPDAMIEVWQADADGRYAHPEDSRQGPRDPAFTGFGRCATDEDGRFAFRTVRPGPVPGPGNALQAPHILVNVFARGLLRQLSSRIYFAGEPLNETDPVLALIEDGDRRATLIATDAGESSYRFDIRLSGAGETVFFEL